MKLIFRFLFRFLFFFILMLSYSTSFSREIILIENRASKDQGELLKSILYKTFHLPLILITLKEIKTNCDANSEAIIQLCLEENGELIIKKMNQFVVKNSLGIFLNQQNEIKKSEEKK